MISSEIKNVDHTNLQINESTFRKSNNIVVGAYRNRKIVRAITNIHGPHVDLGGYPIVLKSYNKWARGADLSNHLVSYYHSEHESLKWSQPIALSFLEACAPNAYI